MPRRPLVAPLALIAPLAMLGGCFSPAPDNAALLCSTDKKCPGGYHCAFDDHCYKNGADPPPLAADQCGSALPVHLSSGDAFTLDTTGFSDDISQFTGCTARNQPGNDGFFAVDIAAGERWHFHVKVPAVNSTAYDPSVYVLPSCDDRACQRAFTEDECGLGRDEHLTVISGTAGRYIVGVDSPLAPGSAAWSVFAIHPVCGNSMKEHSESCDDGNAISGDGCSAACSSEIGDGAMEAEPNDDTIGANPLKLPGATGALTVAGVLKHGCDPDVFAVTVPAAGSIQAEVLDGNGAVCVVAGQVALALLATDGGTQRGVGAPGGGNTCPAIGADPTAFKFAQKLAAGTYFLKVSQVVRESGDAVTYQLHVEVKP